MEVTGTITGTSMLGSAGTMNLTYVGEQPVVEGDGTATTLNAQQFIADGVTKNGNTYYISNANGLNWFAAQANGTMSRAASSEDTFSGKTVVLTQDINLSGAGWTPITKFAGTFDGQNHTISNFNINGNSCVAFFGQISGATIKNVTFDNVTVSGNHYVGVIFGWEGAESIWSYVTNCHVTNATVACTVVDNDNGDKVGGIGGYAVTTTIEGCSVNNIKISAYRDAGGILGYANNKTVVKNNSASGVSLHWDNSVNYKNYTTVSEADLNTHVGEAASSANVNEGNTGDSKSSISSSNVTDIDKVLKDKGDVVLTDDVTTSANDTTANSGYGATGVQVNGGVLDGKGKTLTVNDANSTWDCAVNTTGGTIKNLTVAGAMRGIFMGGATADVYIDNVIFKDVVYTFNSDGGNNNYGVYISNSTLNGWTSFSNVHKEVVFTNCDFGEGSGYAFCRPYNVTTFTDCDFAEGFEIDARNTIVFENCTIGGVALTAENLATLVTSNIANATVK